MLDTLLNPLFAITLFTLMLIFLEIGRRLGKSQMKKNLNKTRASINVAESTVFALMGLLVAFTFSDAYTRFDVRRNLITQEANAIVTAYLRTDLLTPQAQAQLHDDFHQYLETRLATYKQHLYRQESQATFLKSKQLQIKIWNEAVAACKAEANNSAMIVLLPAINNLIDVENARAAVRNMHPPFIIFIFLVGLVLFSSLLAGYNMGITKVRSGLHIIGFTAIVAITIYITFDLEYPRGGFIRMDAFQVVLNQVSDIVK